MLYLVPSKSGHNPITFGQAQDLVVTYAQAIHSFGLKKGDVVALICESCVEWALTDWACQVLGLVLVPIYPTLPADQASYIALDCGAKLLIAQDEHQAKKFANIETVLLKSETGLLSKTSDINLDYIRQVSSETGRRDLATIIYTSGTTGQPKGAMLCHEGCLQLSASILETYGIDETDTFLSFLPLAHVFERYAGHFLATSVGATIAYAGSLASLANDLIRVQPTIMCAVPRFFENMRSRILDSIAKQSRSKQTLFNLALEQGKKRANKQFAPLFWLTDKLVGKKIRERTGGRIKFFVSGGAALAPAVSDFYIAFGINILQGYGLTETTAATSINLPADNRPWTVGVPISCVEVKIAGDGEILTRGPSIMLGYLNLPKETAEVIDSDGWFHTGDIGEFEGKNLKITDRKKDLLVLANGKNIAPQKIESKLKESDLIAEAVLFGDGMEHCIALIVPDFERVKTWLVAQGVESKSMSNDEISQHSQVKEAIKKDIDQLNKTMADFERVKKHTLLPAQFSIESGELTPSLKVKRKAVKEMYKSYLELLGP